MTSSENSEATEPAHRRSSAYVGVVALLGAMVLLVLTTPGPHSAGPAEKAELAAAAEKEPGSKRLEPTQCEPRGATVRRGLTTRRKVVALTFDDGPSDLTNRYIRTLDRFGAHGTFFVVGRYIAGREQVLRRAVKGGNSVGNHTFEHADVAPGGPAAVAQIEPTSKLIEDATGVQPCVFRPPYGSRSVALDKLVKRLRMMDILWSVETADYTGAPAEITAQRAIEGIDRGNIILMHDGGGDEANTLAALPQILRAIKKRGFKAVTIPDLFRLELKPGEMPKPPDPDPLPEPKPEPRKGSGKKVKAGGRRGRGKNAGGEGRGREGRGREGRRRQNAGGKDAGGKDGGRRGERDAGKSRSAGKKSKRKPSRNRASKKKR